jgi:hypothetical protein
MNYLSLQSDQLARPRSYVNLKTYEKFSALLLHMKKVADCLTTLQKLLVSIEEMGIMKLKQSK